MQNLWVHVIRILEIGPLVNAVSSIDRYFSVKHPFRIEIRNKFKFQASVVLCLIFLIFLINVPVFLYLNTSSSPNKKGCGNANYITGFHLILLEICMQLIIPTTITIITNSLTAYQLILTKKILRRNKFDKEFQYAKFLVCARDANNIDSGVMNPLEVVDEKEKLIFELGESMRKFIFLLKLFILLN